MTPFNLWSTWWRNASVMTQTSFKIAETAHASATVIDSRSKTIWDAMNKQATANAKHLAQKISTWHPILLSKENIVSDLYIIATMVSRDGKADSLREALLPATEAFRQEDGCLAYTLLEDQKRPGRFMTYERWRDAASLQAHMISPAMRKLKPSLPDLLGEELKQDFLDARLIL